MAALQSASSRFVSESSYDPAVARHHMIDGLLAPSGVSDDRVVSAMGVVPRERFVPASYQGCAYIDAAIALPDGREMMSPLSIGLMLQALQIQDHESLLIVGGNYGYSAALAAHLGAEVAMVEDKPEAAQHAAEQLKQYGLGRVRVVQGALAAGHAALAPYDALLIDGATEQWPEALMQQVAEGGRAVVIEKTPSEPYMTSGVGTIWLCVKQSSGWQKHRVAHAAVAVLPAFKQPVVFEF